MVVNNSIHHGPCKIVFNYRGGPISVDAMRTDSGLNLPGIHFLVHAYYPCLKREL